MSEGLKNPVAESLAKPQFVLEDVQLQMGLEWDLQSREGACKV